MSAKLIEGHIGLGVEVQQGIYILLFMDNPDRLLFKYVIFVLYNKM